MFALRTQAMRYSAPLISGRRGLASSLLARAREEWTYAQLKQEAKTRGLSQSGNKSELLGRLKADEAKRAGSSVPKGIRTSASSNAATAKSSTPPDAVVSPEDVPVNTPAPRTPFKSSRTVKGPTSSTPGVPDADDSHFKPRRSAPLNIKMPSEEDVEEPGPTIPTVPDNYGSKASEPASPPSTELTTEPKVVKVTGLDEHLSAPSHPTDTTAVNPPVEATPATAEPPTEAGSWSETATNYTKSLGSIFSPTESGSRHSDSDPQSPLTGDERRGLLVLGGIVIGGWFLGGIAKKDGLKESH